MTKNEMETERVFLSAEKFKTIPQHYLSPKMKEWKGRFLKKRNSWTVLAQFQKDIENFLLEHSTTHSITISEETPILTKHNDDIIQNDIIQNDNIPKTGNIPKTDNIPKTQNISYELELPLPIYELLEWMWKEIDR